MKPLNLTDYLPKTDTTPAVSSTEVKNEQQNSRGHVLTRLKYPQDENEQQQQVNQPKAEFYGNSDNSNKREATKETFLNKHKPIQQFQPRQQPPQQNRQSYLNRNNRPNSKSEFESETKKDHSNNFDGEPLNRKYNNNRRFPKVQNNETGDQSGRRFNNNNNSRQEQNRFVKTNHRQQDYNEDGCNNIAERKYRNQQKNEDFRFKQQQQQQLQHRLVQPAHLNFDNQQKNQMRLNTNKLITTSSSNNNDDENDLIDLTKTLSFSNSKYKKDMIGTASNNRQNDAYQQQQQQHQNYQINEERLQTNRCQPPSQTYSSKQFIKPDNGINNEDVAILKSQKIIQNQNEEGQYQFQNNRINQQQHSYNSFNNNNLQNANQFQEYTINNSKFRFNSNKNEILIIY